MNVLTPVQVQAPQAPPASGFDVKRLLGTLRRRLPLIVALPILFSAIGIAAFMAVTPRFVSSVQVMLDPLRSTNPGPQSEFGGLPIDITRLNSVTAVITSPTLLRRVVEAESLADHPELGGSQPGFLANIRAGIPFLAAPPAPERVSREERAQLALQRLQTAVRATRLGFSYIVRIDVTTSDADLSQRVARAIGDAYLLDQLESKLVEARRASVWMAQRLTELRNDLVESEREVERIRRDFGLLELTSGTTVNRAQVMEINTQLQTARGELVTRQSRLDQAVRIQRSGGSIEALGEVATAGTIGALRGTLNDISRRLGDLQQRYSARHPDVLRAEEERRAIERQLGAEVGRIVSSLRNDVESGTARVRALELELARLTASTERTAEGGEVALREAQRRVEANRSLYDTFLNRAKDLEQRAEFQQAEGRIIAPATLPSSPSFPNLILFVALPFLFGLILGVGLAFLLALLESSFVSSTEVEQELGVPSLATLPLLSNRDLRDTGKRLSIIQYALRRGLSRFSEGLRAVRVGLQLSNVDRPPQIVQVTSSVPGEGKSTLASAMAISSAAAGRSTVLVDCDFRHPSVSALFDLRANEGLVDILLGTKTIDDVKVSQGDVPLDIISTGQGTKSPPDLMNSIKFGELLAELSKRYEVVLVDTPPLLAVTDARIVAERVDSVVIVVEWRNTPREIVRQALAVLGNAQNKIAGIVLNKVDFGKMKRYGYGYGYGYSYRSYGRYYRASERYYSAR